MKFTFCFQFFEWQHLPFSEIEIVGADKILFVRFRFSKWNVGKSMSGINVYEPMSGKWGEIPETLKRRCVDVCCSQEVRWKGQCAKMIGNGFKFLWSGVVK